MTDTRVYAEMYWQAIREMRNAQDQRDRMREALSDLVDVSGDEHAADRLRLSCIECCEYWPCPAERARKLVKHPKDAEMPMGNGVGDPVTQDWDYEGPEEGWDYNPREV